MLITLIVPFYNEEQHLSRSIRSILQQTFADYEVLFVDDLSTDGSYALAEQLIHGDERFRLIQNEQKGLFHARNKALAEARGEYICFLDADDELLPDYLSELYTDIQQADADLVVQGFTRIRKDRQEVMSVYTPGVYDLMESAQAAFSSFDVSSLSNVFAKLYRRSIILDHHLLFSPHVYMCEDMFFVVSYISFCRNLLLSSANNYHYIAHGESMSTRYWDYETERQSFFELRKVWDSLFSSYHCPALQTSFGSFYGPYLHRLVFSGLTHPISKKYQKQNIVDIECKFLDEYALNYRPWTKFTRFLKWVIVHRHYRLYLLLVRLAFIRYGIKVRYV